MQQLPSGIPPVVTEVMCTGVVHRARFEAGALHLLDHDVDAERAMAALGGDVPACVRLLELWDAATNAIGAGEMGAVHSLSLVAHDLAPEPPWEPPHLPFAGPSRPGVVRPLMNARLPASLEDVLAQAAVLDCERRWDDPNLPPSSKRTAHRLLAETLERVVTQTLRASSADRDPVRVSLATTVVAGGPVDVEVSAGRGQIRLEVALPLGWLVRVWRAGLASAAGLVVLDVVAGPPANPPAVGNRDAVGVLAISWDVDRRRLIPRVVPTDLVRHADGWRPVDPVGSRGNRAEPWWSLRTDDR